MVLEGLTREGVSYRYVGCGKQEGMLILRNAGIPGEVLGSGQYSDDRQEFRSTANPRRPTPNRTARG